MSAAQSVHEAALREVAVLCAHDRVAGQVRKCRRQRGRRKPGRETRRRHQEPFTGRFDAALAQIWLHDVCRRSCQLITEHPEAGKEEAVGMEGLPRSQVAVAHQGAGIAPVNQRIEGDETLHAAADDHDIERRTHTARLATALDIACAPRLGGCGVRVSGRYGPNTSGSSPIFLANFRLPSVPGAMRT